jgi:predicted nucleotidyltransferase
MRSLDLSKCSDLIDLGRLIERLTPFLGVSGSRWFVIGACARDLLLEYGLGMEIRRATQDLDLAIAADSWAMFDEIITSMGDGGAASDPAPHRIIVSGYRIDLVPFGGIQRGHSISWPGEDTSMSVLGFEDAADDLVPVRLPDGVDVSVVSIPGLTMLKLIAWGDRRLVQPRHDAVDLKLLLRSYSCDHGIEDLYNHVGIIDLARPARTMGLRREGHARRANARRATVRRRRRSGGYVEEADRAQRSRRAPRVPRSRRLVVRAGQDLDIETVTEIFIRVNSAGATLSQADFTTRLPTESPQEAGLLTKQVQPDRELRHRPERDQHRDRRQVAGEVLRGSR